MRTARFLLLIVYVAGHTGLPLPLPAGACVAGACGCGDACQCARETIAAGKCCCAADARKSTSSTSSCCAAKSRAACSVDTDGSAKTDPLCTAGTESVKPEAVAAANTGACCKGGQADECTGDERPRPPVLLPCGCQQEAPEGIAACSDPRVLSEAIGPPGDRCCDWLPPAGGPAAPLRVQAPDDPVPRLTA